ncbi:DUF2290 domain-containing protein [Cetobacterium somerae]|uniref:DUF2290 domain-containing protein n=1 Tax=Cetobacterium somerae TaxID=188913 RepID=UPI002E7C1CB7|nr:DUF2290 domain-containing protein [Cetobacterium somerae]WVJ02148.1 DUF2290 domain-containing protein [Cetobacterium somerae]
MAKKNKVAVKIINEINSFQNYLVTIGLAPIYNTAKLYDNNKVMWGKSENLSILLKEGHYEDIYKKLHESKNYSFKFIDGSIFQLSYTIVNNVITKMRLAYYPYPKTISYNDDMESYDLECEHIDMLDKYVVSTPIRIDYAPKDHEEIKHPKTHLHLGQIEGCRIPLKSPIMPNKFFKFIFYNFYDKVFDRYFLKYNFETEEIEASITLVEQKHGHICI